MVYLLCADLAGMCPTFVRLLFSARLGSNESYVEALEVLKKKTGGGTSNVYFKQVFGVHIYEDVIINQLKNLGNSCLVAVHTAVNLPDITSKFRIVT